MRIVVETVLLFLGMLTLAFSIRQRRLPRGIIEWAVWIIDIAIIALRAAGA